MKNIMAYTLLPLLFFSLSLLLDPTSSRQFRHVGQEDSSSSNCNDRRIYIRQLPSRFNLDLLTNCSQYPLYDNFCPFLANHGLGPKTHNASHSWFRTDPFMLELIFHRRILEYPCRTDDPAASDAVFVPYYAGIDALKYLYGPEINSSVEHGVDLYDFLQNDMPDLWKRRGGHDHFLVIARPAWDLSQPLDSNPPVWGTSLLELPEFYNVTALTFESRAWPWQEQAIPYPTSFHPPNLAFLNAWIERAKRSKRNTLMLFSGGGGISSSPNIRRSIRLECENSTLDSGASGFGYLKVCDFVDCSNGVCEHDPVRFMHPMLRASFCLQPPGDTPTRRATFDGILAGCIPVFFEDLSAKSQYRWHLPSDNFEEFSVFINKESVVFKGMKIFDYLRGIPRARVRRMREKVLELIPRIVYRRHGSSSDLKMKKDAFDIAVDGTLDRIKSKLTDFDI